MPPGEIALTCKRGAMVVESHCVKWSSPPFDALWTEGFVRIPLKLDARSTAKRTAIPRQTGRPFQRKLDTSERSDAGLIVFYAEATGSVNFARRLRCDSPVSLNV